jgi:hypothetical protein
MAKLMVSVRRFLPLYAVIPFLLAGIAAQPAHAKLGPISIRTVYTTDESENYKTPFAAGDRINYHVDVDNTTSGTFPIKIRFRVVANDYSPDPRLYHYDQTYSVDQMPVGLSRFYNPATLPSDAANYFYAVQITITRSNCQGVDCDNDYAESTFTIKSPSSNFIYNGSIAAQWADAYAYSVRSDYSHHTQGGDYENVKGGTDCTNFASNAMYNGGFKMDDQWWSYSVGGVWKAGHAWGGMKRTPSSRQKRARIKIDCYTDELK